MRYALTIVLLAAASFAQAPPKEKPCSTPEFRQFDFWVGEWELTWKNPEGKSELRGTNRIEREFDNCVIHENFSDQTAEGFRGGSVSTYVPQEKVWKQTWVDNQGSYLDFKGEFKDGQMILSREGLAKDGKKIWQRMVWKNIKADSLDWSWERSDDGGKTWKVLWPIHYERKKQAAKD